MVPAHSHSDIVGRNVGGKERGGQSGRLEGSSIEQLAIRAARAPAMLKPFEFTMTFTTAFHRSIGPT